MEIGEAIYYKIIKSLGKLKMSAIPPSNITASDFVMKMIKTNSSREYGTHNNYQIELFNNGTLEDITIGKNTYSYIIKNNTTWYSSYREWHNWVTIEYTNESESGEIKIDTGVSAFEETLHCIIYIFIILTEVEDIKKMEKLYLFIFDTDFSFGSLGQRIDLYKEAKGIYTKIIDKYPFMNEPINKGLQERLKKIKEELLQDALLENNLLD